MCMQVHALPVFDTFLHVQIYTLYLFCFLNQWRSHLLTLSTQGQEICVEGTVAIYGNKTEEKLGYHPWFSHQCICTHHKISCCHIVHKSHTRKVELFETWSSTGEVQSRSCSPKAKLEVALGSCCFQRSAVSAPSVGQTIWQIHTAHFPQSAANLARPFVGGSPSENLGSSILAILP